VLTLPTREFVLVVDPDCFQDLLAPLLRPAVSLVGDLMGLNPPVIIHLAFPTFLATGAQRDLAESGYAPLDLFADEAGVPTVTLSPDLSRWVRGRIERGAEGERRGFRLLSLANHLKADGVVITLPSLVEPRYHLLRHHKFRIFLPSEFPDFVEVCARGHGIPCAARSGRMWFPPDLLYPWAHWKCRRLWEWFNKVSRSLSDEAIREPLRSALLNRYPFILHARDMIRFYQVQMDQRRRHDLHDRAFRGLLNYHLTGFFVHVWGMLDALAGIANRRLDLGLRSRRCGIDRDEFLDALGEKRPGLHRFIKTYRAKWIDILGDVRHPAAHSALLLQQDIVTHTEDSRRTDAEIAAILRREEPDFYQGLPPELVPSMEAMRIENWRMNRVKVITHDAIYVEKPDGGYFRPL
jgi:hypothetical protein